MKGKRYMMTTLEQIRQEISGAVDKEREAEREAHKREQGTRNRLNTARDRMSAALDAGNLEEYKAAGMDAEQLRLEVEFIEEIKKRNTKPAASTDDDKRIRAALVAEGVRLRADSLAQLQQIFTEAADVAADTLKQYTALDALLSSWDLTVMKREQPRQVVSDVDRLALAQIEKTAIAQLERFKFVKGC